MTMPAVIFAQSTPQIAWEIEKWRNEMTTTPEIEKLIDHHDRELHISFDAPSEKPKPFAQEIRQSHGPKIRFNGRLLAQVTMNTDGTKDTWFEAELWETVGGSWIVVSIYRTGTAGHRHRESVEATVIEPPVILDTMSLVFPAQRKPDSEIAAERLARDIDRKCAVMDALEWAPCAHKIRRAMKWKLVKEVA
jgi:hypothetical protein